MNFSKQALLGTGVFLGGGLLLYSVVHQVQQTPQSPVPATPVVSATSATNKSAAADTNPLTADIATEQKILAQKQQEREQRVSELDRQAQQYLTEQQRVEAAALARSRAENQLYADKNAPIVTVPTVTARPVETVTTTVTTNANEEPVVPKPRIISQTRVEVPQRPIKVEPTPMPAEPKDLTTARPTSYQIKKGEGLIALSRRYNVPVSILAKANNINRDTALNEGRTLTIPSEAQVTRLQQSIEQEALDKQTARQNQKLAAEQARLKAQQENEQKAQLLAKQKAEKQAQLLAEKQALKQQQQAEQKAKIAQQQQQQLEKAQKIQAEKDKKAQYQTAQQSLKAARQTVKETDAKGTFGVQVALAADDQKANEIANKLRSAGYSVKTSKTTKGTRVVVGPEKGKVAALALKDKVNNDPRVNMGSAWVLYW